MPKIILTGGGTAGHCIPNIALLPILKTHFDKIYYIGSKTGIEKNIALNNNLTYYGITTTKLKRKFTLSNLSIPFNLIKGINEAKKLIKEIKPDVIFSKGGYVSIPIVIAGNYLKIPVISHESDLTIGLANKLSSKFSKLVLPSFPETARQIKNGYYVGPPLRNELFKVNKELAYQTFGFKNNKPILLITGGSQGAKAINNAIIDIIPQLLKSFNIIHLCGKGNLNNIKLEGYYQTEFTNKIENAFAVSAVCVTRGGSNSLFEILAMKIPSLVIPLPKQQSRGDQILNAQYFSNKEVVKLLYQENLTKETLLDSIICTYKNKDILIENMNKLSIKNSNEEICKILIKYSKQ